MSFSEHQQRETCGNTHVFAYFVLSPIKKIYAKSIEHRIFYELFSRRSAVCLPHRRGTRYSVYRVIPRRTRYAVAVYRIILRWAVSVFLLDFHYAVFGQGLRGNAVLTNIWGRITRYAGVRGIPRSRSGMLAPASVKTCRHAAMTAECLALMPSPKEAAIAK